MKENLEQTTAIISILTQGVSKESRIYNVGLCFVGSIILPPYLPSFQAEVDNSQRVDIINLLDQLKEHQNTIVNPIFSESNTNQLKEALQRIGRKVARLITEYKKFIQTLSDMKVGNVIIYTDDFTIPWDWAFYREDDKDPFMVEDFLMNRYPCGMLLVDTNPDSLIRLNEFRANYLHRRQNHNSILNTSNVCFIQGEMGETSKDKDTRLAILEEYKAIFKQRFEDNVKYHDGFDLGNSGPYNSISFQDEVSSIFSNASRAKIIHFAGCIDQDAFKLANSMSMKIDKLNLNTLRAQPLVVLHGFFQGKYHKLEKMTRRPLPGIFLEKGASGCLLALTPIKSSPPTINDAHKIIMRSFYKHLMQLKPYGLALHHAIKEFQRDPSTTDCPIWLFYRLFADPRTMLFTTDKDPVLGSFTRVEEDLINRGEKLESFYISLLNQTRSKVVAATKNRRPLKVFLSYDRKDKEKVDSIRVTLKEHKIEPWMDTTDVTGGDRWPEEIDKALNDSDRVLIFISANSITNDRTFSLELEKAVELANGSKKDKNFLIPVQLDETTLPSGLQGFHGFSHKYVTPSQVIDIVLNRRSK